MPAAVKAWIKKEIKIQKALHKKIAKAMNEDLAPKRAKWYEEFFERIQRPASSQRLRKVNVATTSDFLLIIEHRPILSCNEMPWLFSENTLRTPPPTNRT